MPSAAKPLFGIVDSPAAPSATPSPECREAELSGLTIRHHGRCATLHWGGFYLTGADFIQFCLRLYAAPGVSRICLQLQDEHHLSVNCLLLAAWGAALGYSLSAEVWSSITRRTAPIREKAVAPIRATRRAISTESSLDDDLKRPLKRLLLYAEVRAEQAEERALHRLMVRSAVRAEAGEQLFRLNLAAYAPPSVDLERFATLVSKARYMELLPCPRQAND